MEGRCQCSQIRFTTPLPKPLKMYICHCTECRHQSSSTYGMTALFPAFEIPTSSPGQLGVYTRPTESGNQLDCFFCTNCGCRLVHRPRGGDTLSVKAGCLVALDKEMMKDAVHIWCKEAVIEIPEGVERWEGEPDRGSFKR
ncbi:glutathione-dependent formaldehyde-activating [Nannizzia gypsea CBS 118893]|uniref:Glutathione-dependent formaldehyde-activating n=1 Tax=Arthroderma gypseum (strain ATCC MYA-4604 / CBS 118893) TaxID=535722 RepID=E4USC5_ARTGP|nr:glutathione-dependent formaldehyde-activating [Nannizzia gypsea CBS 118893]EFR01329.1 glutathione-dependent formaldehyde-activating [Nannizzia gypsea CBS 118893]